MLIAFEGRNEKKQVVFGEPMLVNPPGHLSFDIFLPGSKEPAGRVTRPSNDTTDRLPEELYALLKPGGLEKVAMFFYTGLKPEQRTPELDA